MRTVQEEEGLFAHGGVVAVVGQIAHVRLRGGGEQRPVVHVVAEEHALFAQQRGGKAGKNRTAHGVWTPFQTENKAARAAFSSQYYHTLSRPGRQIGSAPLAVGVREGVD